MQYVILWNVNANFSSITNTYLVSHRSTLPSLQKSALPSHLEHLVFLSAKLWWPYQIYIKKILLKSERETPARSWIIIPDVTLASFWPTSISKATEDSRPLKCGQKSCNSTDGYWETTCALLCSQCMIENDILVFTLRQMNMLCVEKVKPPSPGTDATCELIIM